MPPRAPSKSPAATERRRTRSSESVDRSQRERGRARTERVAKTKAAGGKPRSGESMDLGDELDLMYDEGVREGQKRGKTPRKPTAADVDRARKPRPAPASSSPSSSRSVGDAFPTPVIGASLERAQGKTLILTFTTIAALAAVARDTIHGTPANPQATTVAETVSYTTNAAGTRIATVSSKQPKQPAHLRALAGVFVVGTLALVLNEVNPTLGVSMAGILLLDVGLSLTMPGSSSTSGGQPTASLVDHIGGALFNGSTKVTPVPNAPAKPQPSTGARA